MSTFFESRVATTPSCAIFALAAAGLLTVGCQPTGPELGPPASVLARYVAAVDERDNAAMLACWDPRMQPDLAKVLSTWEDCDKKCVALKGLVIKEFSTELVKRITWDVRAGFLWGDPLYGAAKDGRIDWGRVRLSREGDVTELAVDGEVRGLVVRKVRGKWYISMIGQLEEGIASIQTLGRIGQHYADKFARAARGIRDGTLNEENMWEVFCDEGVGPPEDGRRNDEREE